MDGSTQLASVIVNGSGAAAFSTSALVAGAHTISAVYGGDANFNGSTSTALAQTVKAVTGLSLTLTPASTIPYGPEEWGFSLASNGGISPTGTVNVVAIAPNSNSIGFVGFPTNIQGAGFNGGTVVVGTFPAGVYTIQATYSGDSLNEPATTSQILTVTKAVLTVTAANASRSFGVPNPAFSVTYTGFRSGDSLQNSLTGAPAINSAATIASPPGAYPITAGLGTLSAPNYSFAFVNGTLTITQASSATTLSSSRNPSVYQQTVTLTANVSTPVTGTPTGSISFMDGSTQLANVALNSNGAAAFSTPALVAGAHSITAVYSGDANFTGSTSAALTQTVRKESSTVALSSSRDPSTFGGSVTFSATANSAAGPLTGSISFMDGSIQLASVAIDGNGAAAFSTSALVGGAHTITAVYSGDANFTGSTSTALTQTVNKAASTVALSSSNNPSTFGASVIFSAMASSGAGTPTGSISFMDGSTQLASVALNSNGAAAFSTSALAAGGHSITAVYSGDANFNGSTSAVLAQTVNKAASTLALSSSSDPSTFGASVTFSASASSAAGTPTGSISFMDGSTQLASVALNSNGVAAFSTSTLATGAHSITAVYSGDANFTGSASTALTQTVNKAASAVALSSSSDPSIFGAFVTFSASVSDTSAGSTGTPTGMVAFHDGTSTLGTAALSSSGIATITTNSLSEGSHSISATYAGDGNFSASSSTPRSQLINPASTNVTLSASANPATFGTAVTFSAAVLDTSTGSAGTPTGPVTFKDGTTTLGTAVLNASGIATLTINSLAQGSNAITAIYAGDGNFMGSSSASIAEVINAASTSVVLSSSANPATFGTAVTLSATVTDTSTGSTGTPSGSVTFMDGVNAVGKETLSSSGVAALTVNSLGQGSHTITAVYAGDANFSESSSGPINELIDAASTSVTLSSSANPATFGTAVTLSATVGDTSTASTGTPTGGVTFKDGAGSLGRTNLNKSGIATLVISSLPQGSHSIAATYAGDGNFSGSSSTPLSEEINPASTNVTLSASANPATFGTTVTLSATVTDASTGSTGTPTGAVTFKDGTVVLGTATLNLSGVANITTNSLSEGSHSITAAYEGDSNFNGSSSTAIAEVVNPATTTVSLAASANPAIFGTSITLSATVVDTSTGSVGTPTGAVTFRDGAATLGTAALNNSGIASLTINSLTQGSHVVTAIYGGDGNFAGSSSTPIAEVINAASSSVTLSSSASPAIFGTTITLSATVTDTATGSIGTPTGSVTFKDGANVLGKGSLNSSGVATLDVSSLGQGSHSVTAIYSGDPDFSGSSSAPINQVISAAGTAVTLSSSVDPATFGTAVTLSAAVTDASAGSTGTPTGTVVFKDGSTTLGMGTLNNGVASFEINSLAGGSHSITAIYSGDADFAGSSSSPISQVINPASTSVTLSSSANPAMFATAVTFSATVADASPGSSGTPAGVVIFKDGVDTIGTGTLSNGGVAAFTISSLTSGSHSITAIYPGNGNFSGSTSPVLDQVALGPPDFTLSVSPAAGSVPQGQPLQLQVTVAGVNGFQGTITLGCNHLPATVECNFSQPNAKITLAASSGTSTLDVSTVATFVQTAGLVGVFVAFFSLNGARRKRFGRLRKTFVIIALLIVSFLVFACGGHVQYLQTDGTPRGSYTVTVTGASGNITHTQDITLTVR
jgi:hypothetical protein